MVLVDNSVYSFAFQLDNGVPIIPFYTNNTTCADEELKHMIYYMQCLYGVEDVRDLNRDAFELSRLKME